MLWIIQNKFIKLILTKDNTFSSEQRGRARAREKMTEKNDKLFYENL